MRTYFLILRIVLVIIFIASTYTAFELGSGPNHSGSNHYDNSHMGYPGGAIAFGLIASTSLLCFVAIELLRNPKER